MKKTTFIAAIGISSIALFSCNKHEVIPPPKPQVDLESHFFGEINGTDIELTQNVNGYSSESQVDLIISATDIDRAVYYSEMSSNQSLFSVKVGHGSILFDASTSSTPTLALFNNFYSNNLQPDFSVAGQNGFVVSIRDNSGKTWESNEDHIYLTEDVNFSNIRQESDESGDYNKFICTFDTYVYNTDPITLLKDSMLITNATYEGWFKR